MKDLVWNSTLSVQVDEIDEDHRKLVDLFNILNHAVMEGDAPDYIEAVLEELITCTVWHFRHEERLMLKYGYEGILEHKTEHQELIESAKALQQKFLKDGICGNCRAVGIRFHDDNSPVFGFDSAPQPYTE